jgi:hypothetical protein
MSAVDSCDNKKEGIQQIFDIDNHLIIPKIEDIKAGFGSVLVKLPWVSVWVFQVFFSEKQ